MLVACPTLVNIDKHQVAGTSMASCYDGGERMSMDMIEAERPEGRQIGNEDS